VCRSHPIIDMFGSFPGSLGQRTTQDYRCEGADAIMESDAASLAVSAVRGSDPPLV
jgi:hypothetical protein